MLPTIVELLKIAPYRRLVIGATLFAFGQWMERIAIGWFVFDTTGSVFLTALAWSLRTIPNLVFGPVGGAIADPASARETMKKMMIERDICSAFLGVHNVQQPVDDNPRHRDVKPDRKGPPGDATVSIELPAGRVIERDENHRNEGDGQDHVGDQNGEVDGANPTHPGKRRSSHMKMIIDVRDEEDG